MLELLGDNIGAIAAYQAALNANPQAGCKKQLERLTNAPVVFAEKPKPKPTEERIHLEKLTMFHFRCPICGAMPKELRMQDYMAGWQTSGINRLDLLFALLLATVQEIQVKRATSTKGFLAAAGDLATTVSEYLKDKSPVQSPFLIAVAPKTLVMQIECPVCLKPSGLRRKGNYFTIWTESGGVQNSNLFFEIGAILHGLSSVDSAWLSTEVRHFCEKVRSQSFRIAEALGLMPCPQCGRFTSCLYGGTRSDPEKGMCRWCSDLSGAGQITITINLADIAKQVDQSANS